MRQSFLILPAVSGVGVALAFPDFNAFPLAWIALTPYLWFLVSRPGTGSVLVGHLLFGVFYFGVIFYWIPGVLTQYGGLPQPIAILALVVMTLVLTGVFLPFPLLIRWLAVRSVPGALLVAPGLWTALELARNWFPFGGFPWASLGYSQADYAWMIQVADLGSVYLVSFLVVLVNAGIVLMFRREAFSLVAGIVVVFLLANLYGLYRWNFWTPRDTASVTVGVAQGNIELMAGMEHYAERYFKVLPRLFDRAVAEGARWVIFPEAQNPYRYEHDFYFRQFWEGRTRLSNSALLFNSTHGSEDGYFNAAYLLTPDGRVSYRYDKIHLVPFGEYLPLEWLWGATESLVAEVSHFTPGRTMEIGRLDEFGFATLICYEAIFPELGREAALKGAEFLVNITNDGWFGPTAAPAQHLQAARVRAIETRRPLLRAANTGYSAIIDPWGRLEQRTHLMTEALLVTEVKGSASPTLFLSFGFLPVGLVIIVSLAFAFGDLVARSGASRSRKARRRVG